MKFHWNSVATSLRLEPMRVDFSCARADIVGTKSVDTQSLTRLRRDGTPDDGMRARLPRVIRLTQESYFSLTIVF